MSPQEYFGDWMSVLNPESLAFYRSKIIEWYRSGYSFEPQPKDVFKAFRACPFDACKVVIIGQDPYPQHEVATGIAFANDILADRPMSPSLKVMRDSVLSLADSEEMPIFDPSLEKWAAQGILLLNSALTVATDKPGSHAEGWKPFLSSLVEQLSQARPELFWILFGKQAWEFKDFIQNSGTNVITEYHPAYFARNQIPMGNWMWKRMLSYVEEHFNTTLKLYD